MKKYDVAAYVWPSYTGNDPRAKLFWEEGYGEWQTVHNIQQNSVGKPDNVNGYGYLEAIRDVFLNANDQEKMMGIDK